MRIRSYAAALVLSAMLVGCKKDDQNAGDTSGTGTSDTTVTAAVPAEAPSVAPAAAAAHAAERSMAAKASDRQQANSLFARPVIVSMTDHSVMAYGLGFVLTPDLRPFDVAIIDVKLEGIGTSVTPVENSNPGHRWWTRAPMETTAPNPASLNPKALFVDGPNVEFPFVGGKPPKIRVTARSDGFEDAVCTIDPAQDNPQCEESAGGTH